MLARSVSIGMRTIEKGERRKEKCGLFVDPLSCVILPTRFPPPKERGETEDKRSRCCTLRRQLARQPPPDSQGPHTRACPHSSIHQSREPGTERLTRPLGRRHVPTIGTRAAMLYTRGCDTYTRAEIDRPTQPVRLGRPVDIFKACHRRRGEAKRGDVRCAVLLHAPSLGA